MVIIDPDDDEMSALVLDLPSGHSSGETELQEKNGFLGALDDNSHPKQPLSKISLVSQGEDSLQSNKCKFKAVILISEKMTRIVLNPVKYLIIMKINGKKPGMHLICMLY